MDYDHPSRERSSWRKPYCVALMIAGALGTLWVFAGVISFFVLRLQSTSSPGIVVGYEIAGGKERLRVQAMPDGKPKGFMLLDAREAWPRFTRDQPVQLLTRFVRNNLGQRVQQTIAYAPRNHWQRHAVVSAVSFLAVALGAFGLIGRGRELARDR